MEHGGMATGIFAFTVDDDFCFADLGYARNGSDSLASVFLYRNGVDGSVGAGKSDGQGAGVLDPDFVHHQAVLAVRRISEKSASRRLSKS
jgi:hypothetical protein